MISIRCDEHNSEVTIKRIDYFGINELTIYVEPCEGCMSNINESSHEYAELLETANMLENELEFVLGEIETYKDEIDFLWTEATELKWKAKYNQVVADANVEIDRIKEEAKESERSSFIANAKKNAAVLAREEAREELGQAKETFKIKEAEYMLEIRKLKYELAKAKVPLSKEVKLKRTIDL